MNKNYVYKNQKTRGENFCFYHQSAHNGNRGFGDQRKDQVRLSEKKQNDLLNDNYSLSDENSVLKNELQSLKGVLKK